MAYKEYYRYVGKLDRPDSALCTDILEVKRRKEAAAGWQANSDALAPDAFADDVSNPDQDDHRAFRGRAVIEVYGGLSNYD